MIPLNRHLSLEIHCGKFVEGMVHMVNTLRYTSFYCATMTPMKAKKLPVAPVSAEMLDPDVRFLLANERTLLAWVRTALALIAGGLALTQLGGVSRMRVIFGVGAILFGAIMAALGYTRFRAADTAIRVGELPDTGHGPMFQVAGVVVIAFVIAGVELLHVY